MPRRGNIAKRDVLPDPVYNSKLVTKLINRIMLDGKKGTAQGILYGAFAIVEKKTGEAALDVFGKALPGRDCLPRIRSSKNTANGSRSVAGNW